MAIFDRAQRAELYRLGMEWDQIERIEDGAIGRRGVKVADLYAQAWRKAKGIPEPAPSAPAPLNLVDFSGPDINGRARHPRDTPAQRPHPGLQYFIDRNGIARSCADGRVLNNITGIATDAEPVDPPDWIRASHPEWCVTEDE